VPNLFLAGALGELTALPHTPSWFKGTLLLRGGERRGKEWKKRGDREELGGEGNEREREGRKVESRNTPSINFCIRPWIQGGLGFNPTRSTPQCYNNTTHM